MLLPVLLCLVSASGESPRLEKARAALARKKPNPAEALEALEAAESRTGLKLESLLELLELKGAALALTPRAADARTAFRTLLALDPRHAAPSAGGPKASQLFAEAKTWLEKNPPLSFSARPAESRGGAVKRLSVGVADDALSLALRVQFSTRTPPDTRWEALTVALDSGRAEVRVDGASVEWFASLLGERDVELARLGSEAAPLVERAAVEAPAAVAVPAPAPASPSSNPALVFRVAPIQVVVLQTRELGGATQGALVAEELALALPTGAYKVTTSAQLQTVLGIERQKQMMGCSEDSQSCITELASALGSDVLVASTLAKTSSGLRCNVTFVSGKEGTTLEQVSVDAPSDGLLFDRLHDAVGQAASQLFERQRPGARLEAGKAGVRRFALVPGLLALAFGGAAGALFYVADGQARALKSTNGQFSGTQQVASAAALGRTTELLAWVCAGAGAAALVATGLTLVLGAPTDPKVVLAPVVGSGGGLQVSGVFP